MKIVFAFCLWWAMPAAGAVVGLVNQLSGEVSVAHGDGSSAKARMGMQLLVGDTVKTIGGASAKLVMKDGNVFFVNESSSFIIKEYQDAEAKSGATTLTVDGTIHAQINHQYDDQQSSFRMVTPASIVGVRGTEFLVDHQNGQSQVTTFSGTVDVGQQMNGRKILGAVHVTKGFQYTSHQPGLRQVPEQELNQMRAAAQKPGYRASRRAQAKNRPFTPAGRTAKNQAQPPGEKNAAKAKLRHQRRRRQEEK